MNVRQDTFKVQVDIVLLLLLLNVASHAPAVIATYTLTSLAYLVRITKGSTVLPTAILLLHMRLPCLQHAYYYAEEYYYLVLIACRLYGRRKQQASKH
jgi:hypothetical protein